MLETRNRIGFTGRNNKSCDSLHGTLPVFIAASNCLRSQSLRILGIFCLIHSITNSIQELNFPAI